MCRSQAKHDNDSHCLLLISLLCMQLTYTVFDVAVIAYVAYASVLCAWFAGMSRIITEAAAFFHGCTQAFQGKPVSVIVDMHLDMQLDISHS